MPADPRNCATAREIADRCEDLLRESEAVLRELRGESRTDWVTFLEAHPELDDLASLGGDDA